MASDMPSNLVIQLGMPELRIISVIAEPSRAV